MMKNIAFLLLLTLLISCKKDINEPTIQFDGTTTALLNGKKWAGNIFSSYTKNESCFMRRFSLSMESAKDSFTISEHIVISGLDTLPFSKGFISLKPNNYSPTECTDSVSHSKLYIVEGGDVLIDSYHLLEKSTTVNQLKIINFDSKTNELTASFQFDFAIDDTTTNRLRFPNLPDTLHFTEGVLKTKIRIRESQ
jgi:hypothetical protein